MKIFICGVNYKTTSLETREKLSFDTEEIKQALKEVTALDGIDEGVVLSTCNRTEVYIHSHSGNIDNASIEKLLCDIKDADVYSLRKYFYWYGGINAVRHLFKVSCGLDSLVLGEDQILGQVKEAYELAIHLGASSGVLNTLFRDAITTAKKVKTQTELSKKMVSIGSLAVKLVSDLYDRELGNKKALIIGAGKMGSIVLKNLVEKGIGKVYVTSRTHGRADDLSGLYANAASLSYDERYSVVNDCDIIISATSSPHYTITKDVLDKNMPVDKERVFIDLAVPRDIASDIRTLWGVKLFEIDDLQAVVEENNEQKAVEALKAEEIIGAAVVEFEKWYEFRRVLPVVKDVQMFTKDVLDKNLEQISAKLKDANEKDKEIIKAYMNSAVNEILNKLIYSVRESSDKEDLRTYFKCIDNVMKDGNE